MRHPIMIYADFECFLEKIDTCEPDNQYSYTKQYQKHTPSGFCIKPVCADGINFNQKPIIYSTKSKNEDVVAVFINAVEMVIKNFYNQFKFPKKMKIDAKEKKMFDDATTCHICDQRFGNNEKFISSECDGTDFYQFENDSVCKNCNVVFKDDEKKSERSLSLHRQI